MTNADFAGCRERLKWIDHALRTLDEDFRVWLLENDAHPTTVEYYAEADVHVFRLGVQHPPPRFGVIAGNIVHQIRATLDNLVWQLVIANKKEPRGGFGGNQFPIISPPIKEDFSFAKKTANSLRGVHPDHVAFIERLQPYQTPEWPAGWQPLESLANLSNTDKHQVLQILSILEPNAAVPIDFPVTFEGNAVDAVLDSGWSPVEQRYPGAIVGWAQLSPTGFHPDVQMKCDFWNSLRFPDDRAVYSVLTTAWAVVEVIVVALADGIEQAHPPVEIAPLNPERIYFLNELTKKRRNYDL